MFVRLLRRLLRSPRAAWLVRLMRRYRARKISDPVERAGITGFFAPEDVQRIRDTYFGPRPPDNDPWQPLLHAHMSLPSWFRQGLDPWGADYAQQQHRLWSLISGVERPYDPDIDETEAHLGDGVDAVRWPGFYVRRDPEAVSSASDHVIASGMILKHSGLRPGEWALEYGAGFGQTALALARLGVNVDTVDISRTFCAHVQTQAEFYRVPLTPHYGHFGQNPRPGHRYKLVWFYESFHHCLDFQGLMRALPDLLAEGGRVLLCGEPMVEREYAAVPYPWGVRLHSEVVAVMRQQHWFELGFSEDFLFEMFVRSGFIGRRHACEPSLWGRTYVFERRPEEIHIGQLWLPPVLEEGWHGSEADGRWTRGEARLPLDIGHRGAGIDVDLANLLPGRQTVHLRCGAFSQSVVVDPGAQTTVRLPADGAAWLELRCTTRRRAWTERLRHGDERQLGIFVRRLRYAPA